MQLISPQAATPGTPIPPARSYPRLVLAVVALIVVVVVVVVVALYFAFIYTPSLPIPAGTVIRWSYGDQTNPILAHYYVWAYTVTRCCAHLVGTYHTDHAFAWYVGFSEWRAEVSAPCPAVPVGSPEGPYDGNFTSIDLAPGLGYFGIICGSAQSVTISITQTVQLVYT
jgi:hypothetical protein